jgi:hypothetical protein
MDLCVMRQMRASRCRFEQMMIPCAGHDDQRAHPVRFEPECALQCRNGRISAASRYTLRRGMRQEQDFVLSWLG